MKKKLPTVKAPRVFRPQVNFETWKARLGELFRHGRHQRDVFVRWMEHHSEYFAQIGRPELTSIDALLEVVFQCTQPQIFSKEELQRYESAEKKLHDLLRELDATIGALKATQFCLIPNDKDGTGGRRFPSLQRSLENAASHIRWSLIIAKKLKARSADVISYCITFLCSIFMCESIAERDALELTALLMKAHGFSDEELLVFGAGAVESGRFRQRVKAYVKASSTIQKAQEAFLEQLRTRPSRNAEDIKALSKRFAELIKDYPLQSF